MTADTQAQGDVIALARKCGATTLDRYKLVNFSHEALEAFADALQGRGTQEGEPSDERARFENFIRTTRTGKGKKHVEEILQRMEGGDYIHDHTQRHWWTWQSAMGLTRHAQERNPSRVSVEIREAM